jgi:hypothetical protein
MHNKQEIRANTCLAGPSADELGKTMHTFYVYMHVYTYICVTTSVTCIHSNACLAGPSADELRETMLAELTRIKTRGKNISIYFLLEHVYTHTFVKPHEKS